MLVLDLDEDGAAVFADLAERGEVASGLVNSAGIRRRAAFEDLADEDRRQVLDTNPGRDRADVAAVRGRPAQGRAAGLPGCRAAGLPGAIVNVASAMGTSPHRTWRRTWPRRAG
ncbi:hypothetical protein ACL02T_22620 [Pseudonocardia sp. RS010]|uniref:hypothetical protein n=1 Tax=Pseudonocardia sp. RS010 TaxID=3385979 RepID=UPI0039A2FA8B